MLLVVWLANLDEASQELDGAELAQWQQAYEAAIAELNLERTTTCMSVWDMVYKGLYRFAKRQVDGVVSFAEANNIDVGQFVEDLNQALGYKRAPIDPDYN